ncbi:hypothetical protein [Actinacidiphila acididurans]|uniref:Uncharacterized protein n=1 Tax=Actinacidiphila acididurans TaxID=2784346 RepID=A0ABS2TRG8_9ACTN|nr:hypothetical protein [Actinacidiphila acididurans]MBM9505937.1 hypothetical protein [Actinacidiphila acididurans]
MRRTTYTGAVLLALAALMGSGAPDASAAPGGTGQGAWQPAGTPLAGSTSSAGRPGMRAAVTYRDTIGPNETKFYGITLDAASSAYASVFAVPRPGARVTFGDGIDLRLVSADGADCDAQDAHFQDDDPRPVGTAVARTTGSGRPCQEAGGYALRVHRSSGGDSDPAAWPLELRYVLEPPLRAGATPQAAPYYPSSAATLPTGGVEHPAAGGTSPRTAPALGAGAWQDQVRPGETRFYRVPVDWGQQATVFAQFGGGGDLTGAAAGSSAGSSDGASGTSSGLTGGSSAGSAGSSGGTPAVFIGSGVRLRAYSPVLAYISGDSHSYDGRSVLLRTQLAPAEYVNRDSPDPQVAAVRFAGWYVFAVTVHPGVAEVAGNGAVPVTLRVAVAGTAAHAPAYAGDPRQAGIGLDAPPPGSSSSSSQASQGASGSSSAAAAGPASPHARGLRMLGFSAIGTGTALVLGLALWAVVARRWARRGAGDAARGTAGGAVGAAAVRRGR